MVTVVRMPQLGLTMEKGTVSVWLKKVGDPVTVGEPLCEILTDKVDAQIESPGAGVLRKIIIPEGGESAIGATIAVIADAKEAIDETIPEEGIVEGVSEVVKEVAPHEPLPSPRKERVAASPLAKRLADEMGVDLATVVGTGPGGRITREDVLAAAKGPSQQAAPPGDQTIQLTRIERVAADRLTMSFRDIPQINIMVDVTGDRLEGARADWKARGVDCSYNDLIVKTLADLLREFPRLNAWYEQDTLISKGEINIGIAVDTDDGLVVPVIRGADKRSVAEIAQESKRLIDKARTGRLTLDDIGGGTFTVSNLGMFGVRLFTAILNPPQVALLAVGALLPGVVADGEGAIRVRKMMTINLVCDHRAVDGARAARFLKAYKERLESL
jgi:pyruvate dehydrogenase E2 component (dihydrolipoamide acetyltransferase)